MLLSIAAHAVAAAGAGRTVKVRGADEGDVDTEVAVVGGAVEAQVDAEGNGCPGRVLCAAVEADL